MASGIRLTSPCPSGRLTDSFGWRAAIPGVIAAQLHTGQDWAAPIGTPIFAMHSGRVNRVWWDEFANGNPAGGNMLQVGSALVSTRYAHLSRYAVRLGDEVKAGQVIGYVGTSGASTGAHLHAELLIGGQFANPMPYLDSTPTQQKVSIPLPALIRHPGGTIAFVSDAGEMDEISSMTEVESLQATGIVGKWIQLPDGLIWNTLVKRTARLRAARKRD